MAATAPAPSPAAGAATATASTAASILAGPIGGAIAGAIGNLLGGLFGGGTTFAQASSELHQWVRNNLHADATLQWIKANYPKSFTDIDTLKKLQWVYLLKFDPENTQHHLKWVGVPKYWVGGSWASNAAYLRELGIDVAASEAAQLADPAGLAAVGGANEFIGDHVKHVNSKFIRGTANEGTTPAPSPTVVQAMKDAVDRTAVNKATGKDAEITRNLEKAAGGGYSFNFGSLLPLLALLVVAVLVLRKG